MIFRWLVHSVVIYLTCMFLPGIRIDGFWTAAVFAIVLSLVNYIVTPVIMIFTSPLTILTLGLFLFVINALMFMLAASMVSGIVIANFGWALLASIIISGVYSTVIK